MAGIGRRGFVKGATAGALAFAVGGVEVIMTAHEARARGVPFRLLDAHQGGNPRGARRNAGAAGPRSRHRAFHRSATLGAAGRVAAASAHLQFSSALCGILSRRDRRCRCRQHQDDGRNFAQLTAAEQREFVNLMRQNKIEGWTGRPACAGVCRASRRRRRRRLRHDGRLRSARHSLHAAYSTREEVVR